MIDPLADALLNAAPEPPPDALAQLIHRLIHEANGCPLSECSMTVLIAADDPSEGAWCRYGRQGQ